MTHIVLAADESYLAFVHCVLAQLAVHARSCDGVVLLVPPGAHPDGCRSLERTASQRSLPFQIVEVPQVAELVPEEAIQSHHHVTAFTFSKLLIPTVLPDLDQVLYLDIDILVRDSLDPLLSWPLSRPLGAVDEIGDGARHLFGTTRVPYFNAGVLRMSLTAMRELDMPGRAQDILREHPQLPFHDQDVLNLIFHDNHDSLPFAFNVFEPLLNSGLPSWKLLTDPAIVHFIGPDKPWLDGYRSARTREWRSIQAEALCMSPEQTRRFVGPPVGGRHLLLGRVRGRIQGWAGRGRR